MESMQLAIRFYLYRYAWQYALTFQSMKYAGPYVGTLYAEWNQLEYFTRMPPTIP